LSKNNVLTDLHAELVKDQTAGIIRAAAKIADGDFFAAELLNRFYAIAGNHDEINGVAKRSNVSKVGTSEIGPKHSSRGCNSHLDVSSQHSVDDTFAARHVNDVGVNSMFFEEADVASDPERRLSTN